MSEKIKLNTEKLTYEEFKNEHYFENHQRRVNSSKWGMVTKNVKRHYVIKKL